MLECGDARLPPKVRVVLWQLNDKLIASAKADELTGALDGLIPVLESLAASLEADEPSRCRLRELWTADRSGLEGPLRMR